MPTTSSRSAVTSATMASSSFIIRRARADHDLALLGQPAADAVDQLDVELALEPGHVGRDVGLDRAEGVGGGREAAVSAMPTSACRCRNLPVINCERYQVSAIAA